MNGAEALVRTFLANGVDTCFANPGTSEMHFVAALDRFDGMRCVLGLFEGVATGAADGYARMADRPACTLLHLAPGMANGLANIHNARKAGTPMVNVVGDHATHHLRYDAPLTADVEAAARPFSHWVRTAQSAATVAADAASAIAAALTPPGRIATLILPADTAWTEAGAQAGPAPLPPVPQRVRVPDAAVIEAARVLRSGEPVGLLIAGTALRAAGTALAGRIAKATGARLFAPTLEARIERGAGRVHVDRIPYAVDAAQAFLSGLRHLILLGAPPPVGFFAYPGKPSLMAPPGCATLALAGSDGDLVQALADLAEAVGAHNVPAPLEPSELPEAPRGDVPVTHESMGRTLCALMPEGAIVVDEAVSGGLALRTATRNARPHDWLQLTGGAIGDGLPMAVGAAIACPGRKVVNLQADGSAMYTVQALWTMARENLDVTTVLLNNRAYAILQGELANVGARNAGRKALDMMSLDRPDIDWAALARSMGVESHTARTQDDFARRFEAAMRGRGPKLIDVVL
ncbi:MAG TPA: acetolactate synthase large subunit [Azospirillaceae bacterium]|nr:acetolactate synthase large subunit [Azospirillaceae bacterium]